jgi:prepilin-type N-terminal cleavage/methylation domain-containing protein
MESFSKRRGFTLIELLVVIAIIAILAAILFPVFAQAKKAAKAAATLSDTKQLAIGIQIYANDYDDLWPMTIQTLHSSDPSQPWYDGNSFVGILQMTYPYVKNLDIYWHAMDPRPGSVPMPMVPDPVNGVVTGTWGDWSKEETILPNNVALNVWDGAAGNIAPRSLTSVEFPSELGIFVPVIGPLAGLATGDTNPANPMVDIDPWFNSCVGSFSNSSVSHGWPPVAAAFVAHSNALPSAFGDGHAKTIKQDKFLQDPNGGGCYYDIGITPSNAAFYEGANASKFWGFYLQGWPINN